MDEKAPISSQKGGDTGEEKLPRTLCLLGWLLIRSGSVISRLAHARQSVNSHHTLPD